MFAIKLIILSITLLCVATEDNAAADQKDIMTMLNDNTREIATLIRKFKPKREFDEHLNCVADCLEDEKLPKDCSETSKENEHENGVYLLRAQATDGNAFGAYCENYKNESWTVIQRRQDGSVDFYRNWEAYKNGFGDLSGEYWLGLQRIHELTSQRKFKLWIKMIDVVGVAFDFECSKFSVGNESEGFKLTLDESCKNKNHDGLFHNNGQKFSTFDKDNDSWDVGNCALELKGAWWQKSCSYSNLNGEYKPHFVVDGFRNGDGYRNGLWWYLDDAVSLKYVHIAIHPY